MSTVSNDGTCKKKMGERQHNRVPVRGHDLVWLARNAVADNELIVNVML